MTFDTQPDERDLDETAEPFASMPDGIRWLCIHCNQRGMTYEESASHDCGGPNLSLDTGQVIIENVRVMDDISFDLLSDGSILAHGRTGVYQITNYRDMSGVVVSGRLRCTCLGWRAHRPCRHEKAAVKLALTCTKQEEVF